MVELIGLNSSELCTLGVVGRSLKAAGDTGGPLLAFLLVVAAEWELLEPAGPADACRSCHALLGLAGVAPGSSFFFFFFFLFFFLEEPALRPVGSVSSGGGGGGFGV